MSPRRGARGQTATWPPRASAGYGPAFPWFGGRPRFGAAPFAHVRLWLAEEVAPGRLIPWLPVAFATGILVYFAAQHEPIALPVVCSRERARKRGGRSAHQRQGQEGKRGDGNVAKVEKNVQNTSMVMI